MKIEHIAIWVKDLEKIRSFYESYFSTKAGEEYFKSKKKSFLLLSYESDAQLELMQMTVILGRADHMKTYLLTVAAPSPSLDS